MGRVSRGSSSNDQQTVIRMLGLKSEDSLKERSALSRTPWWRDPSTFGDAAAVVAASVAVALTVLDLLDLLEVGWFRDNLAKITLLLVSLIALSGVAERRLLMGRWHAPLLDGIRSLSVGPYQGLTGVYSRRIQLPSYPELVQSAKKEILIAGVEFGYVALQQIPTLERKSMAGCRIKLLLVDPGSDSQPNPILEPLRETLDFPQLEELLRTSLSRLSHWESQLPASASKRVEIRVTRSVPTHVVTFVDKDLPTGRMVLEMLPPKADAADRWLVLIEAQRGGELYGRYAKGYEQLWTEAQPWDTPVSGQEEGVG